MKINNYTRYIIGAFIMYSLSPLLSGNKPSIFNFCILFLLVFAIIKDISNGNKI